MWAVSDATLSPPDWGHRSLMRKARKKRQDDTIKKEITMALFAQKARIERSTVQVSDYKSNYQTMLGQLFTCNHIAWVHIFFLYKQW